MRRLPLGGKLSAELTDEGKNARCSIEKIHHRAPHPSADFIRIHLPPRGGRLNSPSVRTEGLLLIIIDHLTRDITKSFKNHLTKSSFYIIILMLFSNAMKRTENSGAGAERCRTVRDIRRAFLTHLGAVLPNGFSVGKNGHPPLSDRVGVRCRASI